MIRRYFVEFAGKYSDERKGNGNYGIYCSEWERERLMVMGGEVDTI